MPVGRVTRDYPAQFVARMGAEAIKELLAAVKVEELAEIRLAITLRA